MREYQNWDIQSDHVINPGDNQHSLVQSHSTMSSPTLSPHTTTLVSIQSVPAPPTSVQSPNQIHPTPKQITNHELLTYSRRKKLGKEIEHTIPLAHDQDSEPSPDSTPIYSGMETSDCENTASVIDDSNIPIALRKGVLNACVRRKQWEGAFWVLQQMKEKDVQPSTATYGLVMEVMLACGKYNLVHEFFKKVQKSSIPNALVYKVLVNTFWREGKTEEAVLAVKDMERRGIVSSAALYYDLARCLCTSGRCQEALDLIEKICKVANKPLVVTYTGLIQACLDSGNIQNAVYIFNQMRNFCPPNLVTCNIMLKAYLEHGLFEEANELFNKMLDDGNHISRRSDYMFRVIPDIYTFNTMLDASIAEKRWDDFEYIYQNMLRHGFHFNANRHLRMVLDASRAGKVLLKSIVIINILLKWMLIASP
uniref:Pentatricopeptide repeat-containing protein n=1 Tax=Populus alba TaxID=43335 RepID=A0A4U5NB85_POPAL|nr:pentatricopeptide repeat-containing protein [Populus alba]